jgi:tetratricopeptide (TPR) repeat protein
MATWMIDHDDADRMISGFAWRRRIRNVFAAMGFAILLTAFLIFMFRAEVPELDWAYQSAKSLTELPGSRQPEYPVAGVATNDAGTADQDAGVQQADAMVVDVGGPTPIPPGQKQSVETDESTDPMSRGHRLLEEGDPMKALLAFEEAAKQAPDSPEAAYYMGVSYVQLGKYDSAQAQFEKALEKDPKHVPSVYAMADSLRMNGETKASLKYYKKYLQLSPHGRYRTVAKRQIAAFGGRRSRR